MSGAHLHHDLYTPGSSLVHRLDPRAKFLAALAVILAAVTTPDRAHAAHAALFVVVLAWMIAAQLSPRVVVKRLMIALPIILTISIFVPFARPDPYGPALRVIGLRITFSGLHALASVLSGALIALLAMIVLTATTPLHVLLRGLEQMGAPRLLTALIGFTYRYMFLLGDEFTRMRVARDSRGWNGRWLWQAGALGSLLGSLFLRTVERSERVHQAMVSRGFAGRFIGLPLPRARAVDAAFLLASLALAVLIRVALP